MRTLNLFFSGSILSKARLMQAREFYSPTKAALPCELGFARWAERIALQTELGSARELAGLSDEELAALETEFVRCPVRPRSDRMRHAGPVGAILATAGGIGLALQGFAVFGAGGSSTALQLVAFAGLMVGLCVVAAAAAGAFNLLHLDIGYGMVGLYAGTLDEQHPWLYKTMVLAHNAAAEDYRQGVLRNRGLLRGVDCIIMQEIVRSHDALEQTRSARSVAKQIQQQASATEAASPGKQEPRLVRLATQ